MKKLVLSATLVMAAITGFCQVSPAQAANYAKDARKSAQDAMTLARTAEAGAQKFQHSVLEDGAKICRLWASATESCAIAAEAAAKAPSPADCVAAKAMAECAAKCVKAARAAEACVRDEHAKDAKKAHAAVKAANKDAHEANEFAATAVADARKSPKAENDAKNALTHSEHATKDMDALLARAAKEAGL